MVRVGRSMEWEKKRRIRDWYDSRYSSSDSLAFEEKGGQIEMTRLDLAILFRYFQLKTQDSLILDAGCGSGRLSNVYALLGGRVIGVDISRARLHLAQEGERING